MKRPTKQTALVWSAMAALCIAGTIYEYPHAVDSLWYVRNVFAGLGSSGSPSLPQSVAARDPEAAAVLRFVLKHRYSDPNTIIELRDLVAQYPQNEFFLSQLATQLAFGKHADPNEALATADKLLAVSPNNAHAHYLRAWVLLRAPTAEDHGDEILVAFQEADRLTEFYLPYGKYKLRVAHLAEEAVVPGHEGPRIDLWLYDFLGHRIIDMADWEGMDRESFRRLMASAANMADRVIDDAYDWESLRVGVGLAEELEQIRLRELPLTEDEAWQARWHLAQALALDELRSPTILDTWPSHSALPMWMAWAFTGFWLLCAVSVIFAKRRVWPDGTHLKPSRGLRSIPGAFMLIGLLVVIVAHRWRSAGVWGALLTFPWYLAWFSWLDYPNKLLRASIADVDHPEQYPWRSRTAHALLWLNGTLFLMMSNSEFFTSSRLAGWSQNIGVFVVWSAFCLLLWVSTLKPPVSSLRPRYNLTFVTVIVWAAALIGFDVFGAQRAYESKIWANPLSVYPNIPGATQETYEHFIRKGDAAELGRRKIRALPEYFYYFAPEDMEAYFAQRQTDPRRAVSPAQLEARWASYPRDVLPTIRKALADWDALHRSPPSQP